MDVMEYTPLVRTLARRYGKSRDLADEMQDGYLGLLLAHRSYDPSKGADFVTLAWLCIKRSIWEGIRRRSKWGHSLKSGEPLLDDPLVEADETAALDVKELLPYAGERYSHFIRLHYIEGMTYREIAKAEGVSKGRVQEIVKIGLQSMRAKALPLARRE